MYVHAKVQAGSKKESFEMINEDHFLISVREKAERNQANQRVIDLVRDYFENLGQKTGQIKIVSGHHSPSKLLSVDIKN